MIVFSMRWTNQRSGKKDEDPGAAAKKRYTENVRDATLHL